MASISGVRISPDQIVLFGDGVLEEPRADHASLVRPGNDEFKVTYSKLLDHRSHDLLLSLVGTEHCRRER